MPKNRHDPQTAPGGADVKKSERPTGNGRSSFVRSEGQSRSVGNEDKQYGRVRHTAPAPATPETGGGMRVNKALALAGLCSRRQADEWVASGLVTVNGEVLREAGRKLEAADVVLVRGVPLDMHSLLSGESVKVYLMLNKPVEVVSTVADPEGRKTVLAFVPDAYRGERVYPVGRLDYFSEGLLLLTNDGALTERLTHPRHHLPKFYDVLVREEPQPRALETMRQGMKLAEGQRLAPVSVEVTGPDPRGFWMRLTLHQGVNRQIRRMCRDLNLTILRLIRCGQGPLRLDGLAPGQCRPLSTAELRALLAAAQ